MTDDALAFALTLIELRETRLLGRGIHDGSFTREEALQLLVDGGVEDAAAMLDGLVQRAAVVETPAGGLRTRMAEAVHMLATTRQWFPSGTSWDAARLVVDYRFLHAPRRRPRLSHSLDDVVEVVRERLSQSGAGAAAIVGKPTMSNFQFQSTAAVLDALIATNDRGVVISAGTGSGKTLAFYLPAFAWIVEEIDRSPSPAVKALAIYPRNELLKDQLQTAVGHALALKAAGVGARPLRLATWFGGTPRASYWLQQGWTSWVTVGSKTEPTGWRCPFLDCPTDDCQGHMVWSADDVRAGRERLCCSECSVEVGDDVICLTRDSAVKRPPDVMFTTTESLNRQLSSPDTHRAFGLSGKSLIRMVLLDEVHTYEGTTGAQNAYLLRRLRHLVGKSPVLFAGLSATLLRASEFFSQFTGVTDANVEVIEPRPEDLEELGAEYHLALRHNPASQTGPLSATIQSAMALQRTLDSSGDAASDDPFAEGPDAPTSQGLFGSRTFLFTDKLDVTNRLYWDLLDAEGWWAEGKQKPRMPSTLAHMRSKGQARMKEANRESVDARADDGQYWWMANLLGHDLENDRQLTVGRTSSQDQGVSDADIIVATATLEVGYDDNRVGAVLQHKAPHDAARFLQRKGRAGRTIGMRPWTVVVLSDFGRDRLAFESYDQLFNPQLEATRLPLGNRYVLKMQAVYATLDWLSTRVAINEPDRNVWADLVGPAAVVEQRSEARAERRAERQRRHVEVLTSVLHGGPERASLIRHLSNALRIDDRDVDAVLWGSPRALFLAVLPTVLRRLEQQWEAEVPGPDDLGIRTRTPMREFIAGNLFDDLLVSDVRLVLPADGQQTENREEGLPVARVLQEFLPGNVSRHFGVHSFGRRHWVPVVSSGRLSVDHYRGRYLRSVEDGDGAEVRVYEPRHVALEFPPNPVRDSTSASPTWEAELEAIGSGNCVRFPAMWEAFMPELRFRMHADGDAVRVTRFTRSSQGTMRTSAGLEATSCFFEDEEGDAALGFELEVDGIDLDVTIPELGPVTPIERSLRLQALVDADPTTSSLHRLQRAALAQAVLLLVADNADPSVVAGWANREFAPALRTALIRLGMSAAQVDVTAASDDDESDFGEQLKDLGQALADDSMLDAVKELLRSASGDRDADWEAWQRRRIAAAAAGVLLDAAGRLAPAIDADQLTVDIIPTSNFGCRVWLCESGPGGNGLVEALYVALADSTVELRRLMHASLEPGGLDALADELDGLLGAPSPELIAAIGDVRAAWPAGYVSVEQAIDALSTTVTSLTEPALAAITTRLAAPGAPPGVVPAVSRLLRTWGQLESATRFAFDVRTFATCVARDATFDADLGLSRADATVRGSAVARLLWPRSLSLAGAEDRGRIFGDRLPADTEALRAYIPAPWQTVTCGSVDEARAALRFHLPAEGAVALRFDDTVVAKQSATELIGEPVEVDALLVHPKILAASLHPFFELVFASTELAE